MKGRRGPRRNHPIVMFAGMGSVEKVGGGGRVCTTVQTRNGGYVSVSVISVKEVTMKIIYSFCVALITAMLLISNEAALASEGTPISFTGGIRPRTAPPSSSPESFYEATFSVDYTGGAVMLSAKSDGSGATSVDDALIITVIGPDSRIRTYSKDYGNNCNGPIIKSPPTDISAKFRIGVNQVRVVMLNKCGGGEGDAEGASSFWLLP